MPARSPFFRRSACILCLAALPVGGIAADRPPVKVEAVTLEHRALVEDVSAVGELRSSESVVVRPEVDGRISEIRFTEGTPIEEGALLLRLDDSVPRAELAEARARLDLTRRTYKRARATQSRGHTSEQALDEASAQVRASEAAVALVEARLHKTAILAPFSGIVGLRNVSVGSYVEAGDDITVLEKIDPLKIDFQVPERYLRAVHVGGAVEVHVDAFPAQAYQGSIYAIDPQVDRDNRSISVRARLANPDRVLRSGLFARIRLIIDRRSDAIMVPEEALIPRGARRYVYRVVDGAARFTEVRLGLRRTGFVEAVSGVGMGDVVITAGHAKVREGAAVEVIKVPAITASGPPKAGS